jgi:hypothetical protein
MPTSRTPAQRVKATAFTPLGIIATFVALSEVVAGLASVKTAGTVQLIFAVFAVAFPVLVATLFFTVLWKRSYVFYPPQEFGQNVDVGRYVEAMRHQALGNQDVVSLVQTSIAEAFKSQEAKNALSRLSTGQAPATESALQDASAVVSQEALERVQHSVIRVNIREFTDSGTTPDLVFPYDASQEAFQLLSAIYYQISDQVPPYTYGKIWALRDTTSGQLVLPAGVKWTDNYALSESGATVKEFGIDAGMVLRATRLSAP